MPGMGYPGYSARDTVPGMQCWGHEARVAVLARECPGCSVREGMLGIQCQAAPRMAGQGCSEECNERCSARNMMPRIQCQAVLEWDLWDEMRDAVKDTMPTRVSGYGARAQQGQCIPAEKVSCSCSSTISSATKSCRSLKRPLYSKSPSRSCVANLEDTSASGTPIPPIPSCTPQHPLMLWCP